MKQPTYATGFNRNKVLSKTILFILITLFISSQFAQTIYAISTDQTQLLKQNILYYDINYSCSSGGVNTSTLPSGSGPTIVIDPGHGPNRTVVDSATGLNMVESDNPGEIQYVWDTANLMKTDLNNAGYNVILTKKDINDNVTFRGRADIADNAHAALALSIHGDPGLPDPGEIFVQKVGLFRGSGSNKTVFSDASVATKSQAYAAIFKQERERVSGGSVVIKDNSFNGRAPLEPGNIPMVQLFSKTPWVYNEKHEPFDNKEYAKELEAAVEKSVPINNAAAPAAATPAPATGANNTTCTCTTSSTPLTGSDVQQKVFNYFTSAPRSLSAAAAAGIDGNFGQESTWNPRDSGGYLAQWGGSRLTALGALAIKEQKPVTDLGVQLDYVWLELTNGPGAAEDDRSVLSQLKTATSPEQAAQIFMLGYERPGDPQLQNRQNYAKDIFNRFGSSAPSGGPISGGGCASAGSSPDCATAAGDAKILCEAKKYDPVSYQESAAGNHLPGGNKAWLKTCPTIGPSCYLDCSGLVNIAVYNAFGYDLMENTFSEVSDSAHWKHISGSQIQPGDLIQPGAYGGNHVEIIDHVQGSTIYTFGAHTSSVAQPDQVGPASFTKSSGDVYLHWIGQGS